MSLSAVHSEVEVGASTTFILNMTLPAYTTANYYLEVSLPYNVTAVMHACDLTITHVGYNFPCYDSTAISPTYESEVSYLILVV